MLATHTQSTEQAARRPHPSPPKIDCDVHPLAKSRDVLKQYMGKDAWTLFGQNAGRELYQPVTVGARQTRSFHREDTFPPSGGPPGSDPAFMCEQLLDPFNIHRAILGPLDHTGVPLYGELGLGVTSAVNDWLRDEWLDFDERFLGEIVVPAEDPDRAAKEIRRAAADTRFVQVMLIVPTPDPLGHPRYWPIFDTASELGLPVALHPGGFSGTFTGAGYPSYFLEFHVSLPWAYAAEVVSLVYSGVFERLPDLQLILQEGAISWMLPLMARLDRAYRTERAHLPHLRELPSETIRKHFWFTSQPLEEPGDPQQLLEVFSDLGMYDRIMFASDYPHWDFDSPDRTLPSGFSKELKHRLFVENAERLYGITIGD